MGQKVHPHGFRLGIFRGWYAKWYAEKDYARLLQNDLRVRRAIKENCSEAGVARVEIERPGDGTYITIYAARPGILIGRGGQNVERLKTQLEKTSEEKVRLTIREIETPQLQSCLVAQNIATRISDGIPYRRVMRQAVYRTLEAGAKGVKVRCSGRLAGREIARTEVVRQNRMPLHTLRADIDYGFAEAQTAMGRIGVKVWIYKGDVVPERSEVSVTTETGEAPQSS